MAALCLWLSTTQAFAQTPANTPQTAARETEPYLEFISEASRRFDIPVAWIRAVIHVESRSNARAVSPKGAVGLMQIMPATWDGLRLRYGLGTDPFDPHDNILGGTAYLRELYNRFGAAGFLAAYNAGPKRYQDYLVGLLPLREETRLYLVTLAQMLPDLPIDRTSFVGNAARNWQSATLFITTPSSQNRVGNTLPGQPATRSSSSTSSAFVISLSPHSNGLFVSFQLPISQ